MQAHSKRKKSLISIILSAVVPPNARLVDLVSARDKRGVRASNILGSSSSSWYKSSGGNEERERERENSNYYCWWISVGSWKVFVVALEGEEANLRAVAKIGGEGKNDCGASTYSMMMDRG